MERFINNENPLKDLFFKYVDRIEELQESKNIEELQKTVNQVINILPSNVTSFSIPIYNDTEEPTFVRSERESELSKDQQKEWGLSDLIEYSITIDSIGDYHPVD
ncbi:hypothetical protein GX618_00810 [Candidatus Dojkabacteria bacterium]|uniref:Uncharacterized protein n=1 Tax=Candidatus Dojkabacteria bacterium TaxID=2099670 RepID=A0A847ESS1_9BACT|nr:hypothetical protein [Candidatus Dojkabacteria bacterium]